MKIHKLILKKWRIEWRKVELKMALRQKKLRGCNRACSSITD